MRLMDSLHFTSAARISCGRRIDHPRVALSYGQWRVRDLSRIRSIRGQQWRRSEGSGAQREKTSSVYEKWTSRPDGWSGSRRNANHWKCRSVPSIPRPVSFSAKARSFENFVAAHLDRTAAAPPRRRFGRSACDKRVCVSADQTPQYPSTAQGMWPIRNNLPPNRGSWHRDSTQLLSHRVRSPAN
jgi:hypothetical protein